MKINIKNKLIIGGLAMAALVSTSCVNSDEYNFGSTDKPTVTAAETNYSVEEGDTINLVFNVDQPINRPMQFQLLVDGPAEMDTDYFAGDEHIPGDNGDPESGYRVTIPAYTETFEVPFIAQRDLSVEEGDEIVHINFSAIGIRTALTQEGGIDIDVTIEDEVTSEFIASLDWNEDYIGTDDESHNFCDFDLDLEIYDSSMSEVVASSYSSCPEEITFFSGDLVDGKYYIVTSYYTSAGTVMPSSDYESIPATLTLAKRGTFKEVIDLSGLWTDFEGGLDPDGDGNIDDPSFYETVVGLQVTGENYSITDN